MLPVDPRRTPLGVLLGLVVLGALSWTAADTVTLAVGLGVLLLIALPATTTTAGLVVTASGSSSPGARRLRRQWGRAPIPLLDPGLPGTPQPRAPGHDSPEVPVPVPL